MRVWQSFGRGADFLAEGTRVRAGPRDMRINYDAGDFYTGRSFLHLTTSTHIARCGCVSMNAFGASCSSVLTFHSKNAHVLRVEHLSEVFSYYLHSTEVCSELKIECLTTLYPGN